MAAFDATNSGAEASSPAHRFSTVRMAYRIIVLEGGTVSEQGSHEDLMARGGLYAEVYQRQARGYR